MPRQTHATPIATAEMLAVGSELLYGETRDTNSGDIAGALTALGVEVMRLTQLPDDLAVVTEALQAGLARVDLLVTSGGLGPTPDDLTRESIAAALGEEPFVDLELEAWLRDLWAKRGLPFSNANLKQAWRIPSATALPNPHGTAPGWWVESGGRVIVALPGPPRELWPMWQDHALPRLRARGLGLDRASETLHLTGIGESMLVDLVGADLLRAANPRMATYARPDFVDLRISAVGDGSHTAEELVRAALGALSPRIDAYVFGRGEDDWRAALAARIDGRTLATAEAGTGGYLGVLLGTAPFLVHAEQRSTVDLDAAALALAVRTSAGADIGLAAVAREAGDDMQVEIGVAIGDAAQVATRTAFRGGDAGRRRSANAAITELWRRLAG